MDYTTEQIAKVTHQTNKAWCEVNGDRSQVDWEVAMKWQKDSAISGVQFHLDNPNANDAASHNEWMRHKLSEGWVYGEVKDEVAKTHPCLVPFDELPTEQQIKDRLFRSCVHAIAHRDDETEDTDSLSLADFNPSGLGSVDIVKSKVDELAAFITANMPDNRQRQTALDHLEIASMLAVKSNFV